MFLTQNQVKEMTGAVQVKTQRRWCGDNGIEYRTGNDGKLRILLDHVFDVFNPSARKPEKKNSPNFDAIGM